MLVRYPIEFISPQFAAAGQIAPDDLPHLVQLGFKTIINNRPDHEERGQPLHADIAEAAAQAGLEYIFYPIDAYTFQTVEQVENYGQTIQKCPTPILAFCRVGARVAYAYRLIEHYYPQYLPQGLPSDSTTTR